MKKAVLILFFVSAFLIFGCDEQVLVVQTGDIMGKVEFVFQTGETLNDNSGIEVLFVNNKKYKTVTNSEGRWNISGVESGIYDMQFYKKEESGKTDYDTTHIYAYQFVGNGTAWAGDYKILQRSNNSFNSNLAVTLLDSSAVFAASYKQTIAGSIYLHHRLFIYSKSSISKLNNQFDFTLAFSQPFEIKQIALSVSLNKLKEFYKSGQTVYAVIYPGYSEESYNPKTGAIKFLGLGNEATNVVSFEMP